MKKVIHTDITSTSAMPMKRGTLEHLQSAHQQTTAVAMLLSQASTFTSFAGGIIYGCKITWSGLDFSITPGAVWYLGEIYLTDATTGTITGANVVVGTITTTYVTAADYDPSEFSDATLNNVHAVRTIVWSSAASGSGTVDFDAVEAIRFGKSYPVTYSAGYMTADAGNWTIASSSDWDVKITAINGACAMIDFSIKNSTLTASTAYFALQLGTFTSYFDYHGIASYTISGSQGIATILAQEDDNLIYFNKSTGGNWGTESGTLAIRGQLILSLKPL